MRDRGVDTRQAVAEFALAVSLFCTGCFFCANIGVYFSREGMVMISIEQTPFIKSMVASGKYHSPDEVVYSALSLMEKMEYEKQIDEALKIGMESGVSENTFRDARQMIFGNE